MILKMIDQTIHEDKLNEMISFLINIKEKFYQYVLLFKLKYEAVHRSLSHIRSVSK
jgi:hypothetical protein